MKETAKGLDRLDLATPIGPVILLADARCLRQIRLPAAAAGKEEADRRRTGRPAAGHRVLDLAARQIGEYFRGERMNFTLPFTVEGTDFQRLVWRIIGKIPYGRTRSYGDIARELGSVHKARAVGGAAHCNPLPLIIPCHRVVGADGGLTGFAAGLAVKRFLLTLERENLA